MTLDRDRLIIRATLRDPETLACPMCSFVVPVPPIRQPSDALADALGAGSGAALGEMWAVEAGRRAAGEMRRHLEGHTPEDWLGWHVAEETP